MRFPTFYASKSASVVLILSAFMATLAAALLAAILCVVGAVSLLLVLLSFLHDFNLLFRLLVLCYPWQDIFGNRL